MPITHSPVRARSHSAPRTASPAPTDDTAVKEHQSGDPDATEIMEPPSQDNLQVSLETTPPAENVVHAAPVASTPQAPPVRGDDSAIITRRMQSLVVQTQKEPPRFNGNGDPLEWLREFRRVANFNGHSMDQMMASAPFCLAGEALDWFDNEAEDADDWTTFEESFRARFVDATKISEEARDKLKRIVYEDGTSFTRHFETVLKLCRKLQPKPGEVDTIRKVILTFGQRHAMTLASKAFGSLTDLRNHMSYLDRTIPFVNQQENDAFAMQAIRSARSRSTERRSPAPPRSSDPPFQSDRRAASPQLARSPAPPTRAPPRLSGNRRDPVTGDPYCNWCDRRGHIFRYCHGYQRGDPPARPQQFPDGQQRQNQGN